MAWLRYINKRRYAGRRDTATESKANENFKEINHFCCFYHKKERYKK